MRTLVNNEAKLVIIQIRILNPMVTMDEPSKILTHFISPVLRFM